ncbi:hypothetical protein PXO_05505 [Xanthomonas oryzae pv. oryzae PXO99A]|uniref:Uncharacterized protein n=1 Tax=Xanthomonas oryzae pv. oryzae (strain PXO99A) TaxID=360094 RepID=A0A0K0GID8_XANOP|nr:hypothetical protein PXO_05505 [Xanthomonas oryzae pv. oryzae PXO99A]
MRSGSGNGRTAGQGRQRWLNEARASTAWLPSVRPVARR